MNSLYIISILLAATCVASINTDKSQDDFEYPCPGNYNIDNCVRDYFNKSGRCKAVSHQDGVPIPRADKDVHFPNVNLTMITTKAQITFLNPKIRAFYFNKNSGNIVFAIDYGSVNMYSQYSSFLFHQVAKEAIVIGDNVNGTYPCTLTAIIPTKNGIVSKNSISHTSITASIPISFNTGIAPFVIGPKVMLNTNPIVVDTMKAILETLPTIALEIFHSEAPNLFLLYLQNYICDYGIVLPPVVSTNTI